MSCFLRQESERQTKSVHTIASPYIQPCGSDCLVRCHHLRILLDHLVACTSTHLLCTGHAERSLDYWTYGSLLRQGSILEVRLDGCCCAERVCCEAAVSHRIMFEYYAARKLGCDVVRTEKVSQGSSTFERGLPWSSSGVEYQELGSPHLLIGQIGSAVFPTHKIFPAVSPPKGPVKR